MKRSRFTEEQVTSWLVSISERPLSRFHGRKLPVGYRPDMSMEARFPCSHRQSGLAQLN